MNTKLICLLLSLWSYQIIIAQGIYTSYKPFNHDILIHTSKPTYVAGEKIWLSIYLINSNTQQLLVLTHPLYVQLYAPNGSLVISQTIYTAAGRGSGSLKLSPSLSPGIYRLQAFTQSMVLAKQSRYEIPIFVGVQPTTNGKIIKNLNFDRIKIRADSTTYSPRSAVKLMLDSDFEPNLDATLSISVFHESNEIPRKAITFHTEKVDSGTSETAEQLLYMGRVADKNGKSVKNGQVILFLDNENGQKTYLAETDSSGFFIFNNLVLEGEKMAYWQVNNSKRKTLPDANIKWIKFPQIPLRIDSFETNSEPIQKILQPSVYKSDGDSVIVDEAKLLNDVIIRAKRQEQQRLGTPVLHKASDVSFAINFENNQFPNMHDGREHGFYKMLRYLPKCPPGSPPKYLIDGVTMDNPEEFVDTRQIKRIELLRGAYGMIYGSTCVYAVYTFGVENKPEQKKHSAHFKKLEGYQPKQTFYSPNHEKGKIEEDNRQTLYWNPELTFQPKQKEVSIRFFTSDITGTYRVEVQGMSNKGPVFAETSFVVE